jgi:hypothetical protein
MKEAKNTKNKEENMICNWQIVDLR